MSVKQLDPMAIIFDRRISSGPIPENFTQVIFDLKCKEDQIKNWIYENTKGKFYLGIKYEELPSRYVWCRHVAAFERESEASMFALILTSLNISNHQ